MKNKIKTTLILFLFVFLLACFLLPASGIVAFALEAEDTPTLDEATADEEVTENTTEETTTISASALLDEFLVPIVTFVGGLTAIDVIAFILVYIKSKGKVKTLQAGYTVMKNNNSTLEKEVIALKDTITNMPTVEKLMSGVKDEMSDYLEKSLTAKISEGFKSGTAVNADTLGNTEVISSKLDCLIKALVVMNKGNDSIINILAKSPYTATVNKLTQTVSALKSYVAEKTGSDGDEIAQYIENAIKGVQ